MTVHSLHELVGVMIEPSRNIRVTNYSALYRIVLSMISELTKMLGNLSILISIKGMEFVSIPSLSGGHD